MTSGEIEPSGTWQMNRITVDNSLTSELDRLNEPAEVVDPSGRRLGHFVPAASMAAPDECPYSPEELERMRSEEGGRPLGDIWRSLGAE